MADRRRQMLSHLLQFLSLLGDLVLLNVYWILTSLPIITIGPASCALAGSLLKLVRDEMSGVTPTYFRLFRENFRPGLIYGLMGILGTVILWGDLSFALAAEGPLRVLFLGVSAAVGMLLLTFLCYVFGMQASFSNTISRQIANSLLLAFVFPLRTILLWIFALAVPMTLLFFPPETILTLAWFYLLFGVSLPAYFGARILRGTFDRFAKRQADLLK